MPTELDDKTDRLLQAVAENPGLASSTYPKLAGMSPRSAGLARRELVSAGLIQETSLQTKSRGRAAIVLTLTKKGDEVLKSRRQDTEVDA